MPYHFVEGRTSEGDLLHNFYDAVSADALLNASINFDNKDYRFVRAHAVSPKFQHLLRTVDERGVHRNITLQIKALRTLTAKAFSEGGEIAEQDWKQGKMRMYFEYAGEEVLGEHDFCILPAIGEYPDDCQISFIGDHLKEMLVQLFRLGEKWQRELILKETEKN